MRRRVSRRNSKAECSGFRLLPFTRSTASSLALASRSWRLSGHPLRRLAAEDAPKSAQQLVWSLLRGRARELRCRLPRSACRIWPL